MACIEKGALAGWGIGQIIDIREGGNGLGLALRGVALCALGYLQCENKWVLFRWFHMFVMMMETSLSINCGWLRIPLGI